MYFKIIKLTKNIIQESIKYFPINYVNSLKNKSTFNESIVSRYYISKYIEKEYWLIKYLPQVDKNWIPIFENDIFWSISHKENLIFIWVNYWNNIKKLGLDIEIYKERDLSLLNTFLDEEYKKIWNKNWNNFYILWTAKESIIKFEKLNLDEIWKIKLFKVEKYNKYFLDSKLKFDFRLYLKFCWKEYIVLNWFSENVYYSIL